MPITQKTKIRSNPWFGCYHICAKVRIPGVGLTRGQTHESIDEAIEIKRTWLLRLNRNIQQPLSPLQVNNLHLICDFLNGIKNKKLTFTYDHVYLYTNDMDAAKGLCDLPYQVGEPTITTLNLVGTAGSICLKKSNFKYRSYFNFIPVRKFDDAQWCRLVDLLSDAENVKPCPSLGYIIDSAAKNRQNPQRLIYDHMFIDYMQPQLITMIMLQFPKLIRKTFDIVVYK